MYSGTGLRQPFVTGLLAAAEEDIRLSVQSKPTAGDDLNTEEKPLYRDGRIRFWETVEEEGGGFYSIVVRTGTIRAIQLTQRTKNNGGTEVKGVFFLPLLSGEGT